MQGVLCEKQFSMAFIFREAFGSRGWRKTSFTGASPVCFWFWFVNDLVQGKIYRKHQQTMVFPMKYGRFLYIFPIQPVQWMWKCQFRDTFCVRLQGATQALCSRKSFFKVRQPLFACSGTGLWMICRFTHGRIHDAAIYGNMDPINIPPLC